jgi:hypothetical protein
VSEDLSKGVYTGRWLFLLHHGCVCGERLRVDCWHVLSGSLLVIIAVYDGELLWQRRSAGKAVAGGATCAGVNRIRGLYKFRSSLWLSIYVRICMGTVMDVANKTVSVSQLALDFRSDGLQQSR